MGLVTQQAEEKTPTSPGSSPTDVPLKQNGIVNDQHRVTPVWRKTVAKALHLRFHEDLRTIGIVAFTYALFIMRWRYRDVTMPMVASFVCWWTLAIFSWFCATIVHNCVHVPQFDMKSLNNIWQIMLCLIYGFPVSTLIPGHNLSHHKFTQGPKDVMRTTKMRYDWHLLNILLFLPTIFSSIQKQDSAYMKKQRELGRPIYYQAQLEIISVIIVQVLFLYWDWRAYIFIILTPQIFAKFGIISINMPQHDGCPSPEEDKYNCARNFTGPVLNFFTCNNGYHTMHHLKPGLHWSKLKIEHERLVKPYMHPELDQPNLPWYLFKTFALPGGRRSFDGSPLILPPDQADVPWYLGNANCNETYSDKSDM